MKRVELLKRLRSGDGYSHEAERGPHTSVYATCGANVQVPRHKELNKWTVKAILKRAAKIGLLTSPLWVPVVYYCLGQGV